MGGGPVVEALEAWLGKTPEAGQLLQAVCGSPTAQSTKATPQSEGRSEEQGEQASEDTDF